MWLWQFVCCLSIFFCRLVPESLPAFFIMSYSKSQAEEIVEDFEDLKDTEFSVHGSTYIIEDVIVVPSDAELFSAFFESYGSTRNATELISAYNTDVFDVIIVVTPILDDTSLSYFTVRQYVSDLGVSYNFP